MEKENEKKKKKKRETPTSSCACAHPREPLRITSFPVKTPEKTGETRLRMSAPKGTNILYYYTSKKKAPEKPDMRRTYFHDFRT
jgi:hypothetical protein